MLEHARAIEALLTAAHGRGTPILTGELTGTSRLNPAKTAHSGSAVRPQDESSSAHVTMMYDSGMSIRMSQ